MISQQNLIVNENLQEFEKHKNYALKIQKNLANIYQKQDFLKKINVLSKKGQNILDCGTALAFQVFSDENNTRTLHSANFCKHKLCPFCAWRWHLKQSRIIKKTFEILDKQNYYHLVLTIPNTNYLTKEFLINLRLKTREFMKKIAKSQDYFVGFEITIDKNKKFHPHYHIVYIDHNEKPLTRKAIQTEWAKIANTGTNYAIAKQTKCTGDNVSMELTKYILKFDEIEPSLEILKIIDFATKGIHKFSTAGAVKEAENIAKKEIEKENFNKMQSLTPYNSIIEFYKWMGNCYNLIETKEHKK